ncbi:MAG: hypothetical protein NT055_01040 [Nitrospirae bacterium]|nr:hypothetical protein [Nitrospirota bacterium]
MIIECDGYWIWLLNEERPDYKIMGKYLFFSEDKNKLIEIAKNEIENHNFHQAKVNEIKEDSQTEHVLCLYFKDDSRKHELARRNEQEYKVKYRYWKSDEDTRKGQYSEEFLNKLSQDNRDYFTRK